MGSEASQPLTVELGDRSYPIHIRDGLLADRALLEATLKPLLRANQVAVITNPTVEALYGEALLSALPGRQVDVFSMPDGEAHKNLETYGAAMDFLMAHRHNRTTTIVALGGGVVGDLAGFVAATFQRGVDFVQVPTTLLAQVDSSVGGKTAVNHPAGKNMIGAFYQPRVVLIDTQTLTTLPPREYTAGLAEVVKYGVIADAEFFSWMEANAAALVARDPQILEHAIRTSCATKARVVAADEREASVRAILNFGHTFGHAIEKLTGYGAWLHGEAVSIGMVMAARFSHKLGLLDQGGPERIRDLLLSLGCPVALTQGLPASDMMDAMGMDKKATDGNIRFVVTPEIGSATLTANYADAALREVLDTFSQGQA